MNIPDIRGIKRKHVQMQTYGLEKEREKKNETASRRE
jgi:hypothetical protein